MTNPLLTFVAELVNRWKQSSPKLFQVLTNIFSAIALLVYLPQLLTFLDITLPEAWNLVVIKIIGGISFGIALVSKLTVSQATVVADTTNVLPFTEQHPVPIKAKTLAKQ